MLFVGRSIVEHTAGCSGLSVNISIVYGKKSLFNYYIIYPCIDSSYQVVKSNFDWHLRQFSFFLYWLPIVKNKYAWTNRSIGLAGVKSYCSL